MQAQQIAALVAKDGFLARLDRLARSGAEIRMGMALGNHGADGVEQRAVEDQVNQWIKQDLDVTCAEYDKTYAKDIIKAHGEFWDKYPDQVKVYTIGKSRKIRLFYYDTYNKSL